MLLHQLFEVISERLLEERGSNGDPSSGESLDVDVNTFFVARTFAFFLYYIVITSDQNCGCYAAGPSVYHTEASSACVV